MYLHAYAVFTHQFGIKYKFKLASTPDDFNSLNRVFLKARSDEPIAEAASSSK